MRFRVVKHLCAVVGMLLICGSVFAQQPASKGAIPSSNAEKPKSEGAMTRAVVIGVSNYEDDGITDLNYAHVDAQEMVKFLQSTSGGQLPKENIRFLPNERATVADIYSALDWLLLKTRPGDQVIIYFSGHGDVESKLLKQKGFLLAYDTPPSNYRVGALRIEDLNDYLENLVLGNKSKVFVFTDACRSGHLAGGEEGVKTTAENFASVELLKNEVKIMSCKPDELSLEDKKWGGGRGIFSYHLVDGLSGLADANNDHVVDLSEIDRYLLEKVPSETDGSQNPNSIGAANTPLFTVDAAVVERLRQQKLGEEPLLSAVASRGMEQSILAQADTNVQELYHEFQLAVANGYFLPSDWEPARARGKSASELYDVLVQSDELEPLHFPMKQSFVVALQNNAQQSINAYLAADPDELEERWYNFGNKYKKCPVYLEKSASLLGESHVLYRQLLAKKLYFEGLIHRLDGEKNNENASFEKALEKELAALDYDSLAAYIYNEIGLIYNAMRLNAVQKGEKEKADRLNNDRILMFQKAITVAPKWAMPVNNLAVVFKENRQLKEAEAMAQKAIGLRTNLPVAYYNLADIQHLDKRLPEAAVNYKKAIELHPEYLEAINALGILYREQNNFAEAQKWYLKALAVDSTFVNANMNLGVVYLIEKRFNEAEKIFLRLTRIAPTDFTAYYNLACIKSQANQPKESIRWLNEAILRGLRDQQVINTDPDLENIRSTTEFKDLMKQHFPKK